jgi:ABC-type multidrug transport system ATPase subunit
MLMSEMENTSLSVSIKTQGLSKRFNREWIFRNLDFEFQPGNVYAITGPNGSGKSTLLQILWGQVPQTAGTVNYSTTTASIKVEEIHNHVSIAAPYMDLIEDFTLEEMLNFHFKLRQIRNGISLVQLLDILYLSEARDKFIRNFSSGMKQRLKLGLALYTESAMVFLDEPGSHLDATAFTWYKNELEKLPADTLVFIGSNDPEEFKVKNAVVFDIRSFKR